MYAPELLELQEVNSYEQIIVEREPSTRPPEQVFENIQSQHGREVNNIEETQMTEQISCVKDEKLHQLQLSKQRELNALTLNHLLRNEVDLLSKAKAKKEVTEFTLQSHIEEIQENEKQLNEEIAVLDNVNEQLLQEREIDAMERLQLEEEMANTKEMIKILHNHFTSLKQAQAVERDAAEKLKHEQEQIICHYEMKKQELLAAITEKDEELQEINNTCEIENSEYETKLHIVNERIKELSECEIKVVGECTEMEVKYNNLQTELEKNDTLLNELHSQNLILGNSINDINLEEMNNKIVEDKRSYENCLTDLQNKLVHTNERLNTERQDEAVLQGILDKEIDCINELEFRNGKLEEELVNLLSTEKELCNESDKLDSEWQTVCNSLTSELQKIKSSLAKRHQENDEVIKNNNEKLSMLKAAENANLELELKLAKLQDTRATIVKDIEIDAANLKQLELATSVSTAELSDLNTKLLCDKENYLTKEKLQTEQLNELEEKLLDAQTKVEKVKKECSSSTQGLQDELCVYKTETEKVERENREKIQTDLEKLEEELANIQCEFKEDNEKLTNLQTSLDQKKTTFDALTKKRDSLSNNQERAFHGVTNMSMRGANPSGILKSPGTPTASKNVTWRIPSTSSIGTASSSHQLINEQKSTVDAFDDLFNELYRTSPPELLVENSSKKRCRYQ